MQALHQRAVLMNEEYQDTEDLDGLFSGYDPRPAPTTRRAGPTRASRPSRHRVRGQRSHVIGPDAVRRPRGRRCWTGARLGDARVPHDDRRCSIRAACSRSSSGTSRGTRPEMVERDLRHRPEDLSSRSAGRCTRELRPRADRGAVVYAVGWTQHTVGRAIHPGRERSSSCCWATSAGPAAASARCAATPASRAPPTSRRCSTCCPATCRCRCGTHEDLPDYLDAVRGA